ncbi:hypothetical protein UFOVP67_2 [uncultured Caudovirales phage]|uniref:Uncharacterized protein n=1 Tax=uncultured Caudovirales phage TaxID=2100421 RepID=A0A6J5TAI4_9CAUD|nr:hypothetical protein UFOVP67_2 [uncultured Caudovirales phage]
MFRIVTTKRLKALEEGILDADNTNASLCSYTTHYINELNAIEAFIDHEVQHLKEFEESIKFDGAFQVLFKVKQYFDYLKGEKNANAS